MSTIAPCDTSHRTHTNVGVFDESVTVMDAEVVTVGDTLVMASGLYEVTARRSGGSDTVDLGFLSHRSGASEWHTFDRSEALRVLL